MDTIADKETWARLLQAIGLKLDNIGGLMWHLYSCDSGHEVGIQEDADSCMCISGWRSLYDLEECICCYGNRFVIPIDCEFKTIAINPWLGAKSLEELEIKKDLVVVER